MILIDTDILIEIFDKSSTLGQDAVVKLRESGEEFCTSSINLHEILFGLSKYAKPIDVVANVPILPFAQPDAALSAQLELEAERHGVSDVRSDAMVAAIAINNHCKVFTNNRKHFENFEGLEFF